MAQIFPEWVNRLPVFVAGIGGLLTPLVVLGVWYYFSPEYTDVGYQPEQPVAYSHALHAGELGIDCRYCHIGVETAAVASVPPTSVCLNCHKLVKRDSELLVPIHQSAERGEPMLWQRIHELPDYAYFDHSVHIGAGVGCSSCHGDIAAMEVVQQAEPLSMAWCLDCHRNPDPHLRPADQIYNTAWKPGADQLVAAAELRAERQIAPPEDCSACHR